MSRRAIHTLEGFLALALVLAGISACGWLLLHGHGGGDVLAALAGPSVASAFLTHARTRLKTLLTAALPRESSTMDLDATIDAYIQKIVASKIPAAAALQPECDAAIAAAEALARKALEVYAVQLLAKRAPALTDALKAAFPNVGL